MKDGGQRFTDAAAARRFLLGHAAALLMLIAETAALWVLGADSIVTNGLAVALFVAMMIVYQATRGRFRSGFRASFASRYEAFLGRSPWSEALQMGGYPEGWKWMRFLVAAVWLISVFGFGLPYLVTREMCLEETGVGPHLVHATARNRRNPCQTATSQYLV